MLLFACFLVAGVLVGIFAKPYSPARGIDAADIHYFRDDASQLCYAYVQRPDFKAMIEVDCGRVRW